MQHPTDNIGYLINKTSKMMKYKLNEMLKKYDLTSSQWAVLNDIYFQERLETETRDTSPAAIASRLYTDRPTLSGILERLLKKTLIVSNPNPEDRRSQLISLTDTSKQLILCSEELSNIVVELALKDFGNMEVEQLKSFLQRMDKNLE